MGENGMSWARTLALAFPFVAATGGAARCVELAPGFYPGAAELQIDGGAAYKAFLERNKAKIERIALGISIVRANHGVRQCVGADIYVCISTLASILPIGSLYSTDIGYGSTSFLDDAEQDINGKLIKTGIVWMKVISGNAGSSRSRDVLISQGDDGKVTYVHLDLAGDPLFAKTLADYEQTHVYEAALATMPGTCEISDRRKFYQFIENTLKPTKTVSHDVDANAESITDSTQFKVAGKLCGLPVEIGRMHLVSSEDVSEENPHGSTVYTWWGIGSMTAANSSALHLPIASTAHGHTGPRLGINLLNLPPEIATGIHRSGLTGAWVVKVTPGSVAEKAGIKPGDIVTEYNGKPIHAAEELEAAVHPTSGALVRLKLVRSSGGKVDDVDLNAQF